MEVKIESSRSRRQIKPVAENSGEVRAAEEQRIAKGIETTRFLRRKVEEEEAKKRREKEEKTGQLFGTDKPKKPIPSKALISRLNFRRFLGGGEKMDIVDLLRIAFVAFIIFIGIIIYLMSKN
jgi:hypothetical protein